MNERITAIIGALIIAAIFFAGGVLIEKQRADVALHECQRQCHRKAQTDVNPIGFHAQGQVQVNYNKVNIQSCKPDASCTFAFDFSTDANAAQLGALTCEGYANCMSFSGDKVYVADAPDVIGTMQKVNGRVVKLNKRESHKGDGGLGFHAKGVVQIYDNSLNLDSCKQGEKCTISFDFSTDGDGNEPKELDCASSQPHCLNFDSLAVAVANGPIGIRNEDEITGRVVLISQP